MKVLVLGSGAREHALAHALAIDSHVDSVTCAPGNPGTATIATNHAVSAGDASSVVRLAREIAPDLVVIGPEAPLVAGVADAVRREGIACFGPSAAAARLEGSKAFAKEVMAAAGVPTAKAATCTDEEQISDALNSFGPPYVVKDDGLAGGKGVLVTRDRTAAEAHARSCASVVVEQFLDGLEASVFALTDGDHVVPLRPARDYKRARDGDTGSNTGGMGAYSPLPWDRTDLVEQVTRDIIQPTVDTMRERGCPYTGLLYAGVALTSDGPKVVEFNARFGDPETQAVLAGLRGSLGRLLWAAANGKLADVEPPRWQGAAVTVVLAAEGYPDSPAKGDMIDGLAGAATLPGVQITHAGTAVDGAGHLVSAGGRVLSITGVADTVPQARDRAYQAVGRIRLRGGHYRTDIALPPT